MKEHILVKDMVFYIIICSSGTPEEALEWANKHHPAGDIFLKWHISEHKNSAPVDCAEKHGRKHYIFQC
jgi:hypothetical protein